MPIIILKTVSVYKVKTNIAFNTRIIYVLSVNYSIN